ncbi:MOSC domain-containing protein [Marssonina coronariae]|uniref:MOSC domain-containing protein n=1 Tax=Diplocarpon coronariae TaxID=2795749 RepID=A0A218YSS5_9HELO|nr:MOSC domain-containing protein [Marssonina coronariae]
MAPVLAPDSELGLELDTPWHIETDTVQQLRTSVMKQMRDLPIMTGIYKEAEEGRIWCSFLGLQGDEHDLTFHGGVDKAVHQYSAQHYPLWAAEYPDNADAFVPGAFGENVVSERMHERNVCIGDVVRIGAVLLQLAQIDEFGIECKKAFKRMIDALKTAEAEKSKPNEVFEEFTLVEKTVQTPRITSFIFSRPGEGKAIGPGSFVRLQLPNGLLRSYSIVNGNTHRFQLGIALDEQSRGGSKFLHQNLHLGDALLAGHITPSVPKIGDASSHIFLVGGIGITAFLALIERFQAINYNYTLHYAVRSREDIPFRKAVTGMGKNCVVYAKDEGARMDVGSILRERAWNSMVYACAPVRMMATVEEAAIMLGIEEGEIHCEAFQADYTGDPFEVEVVGNAASSGKEETRARVLDVPSEKTLLSVIREAGLEIDSSCEVGNCGACKVMVRKGVVEHRGSALSAEEKGGGAMLACVSRGVGRLRLEW